MWRPKRLESPNSALNTHIISYHPYLFRHLCIGSAQVDFLFFQSYYAFIYIYKWRRAKHLYLMHIIVVVTHIIARAFALYIADVNFKQFDHGGIVF